MTRKRIGRHIEGGSVPADDHDRRHGQDALREVLSRWASSTTIVAVRDGARVHALTVTAFMPLSVDPPLVAVGLGANAAALPYLRPGSEFAVSLLSADQRGLASRYADVFPVGPDPFPGDGPPVVRASLAWVRCQVEDIRETGDHHLVTGRVTDAGIGDDGAALVYFRRDYPRVPDAS
jgi:flavin reductase (DIM6/NTAB) family NADH-FMN oxidoreductase RutF